MYNKKDTGSREGKGGTMNNPPPRCICMAYIHVCQMETVGREGREGEGEGMAYGI